MTQLVGHVALVYGSHARGDVDGMSDVDVLLISDSVSHEESRISQYTWAQFWSMHSYGSLFLHHLKSEAVILGGHIEAVHQFERAMHSLPAYSRAAADIKNFKTAWRDIADAVSEDDFDPMFELRSLATLTRHASIVGSYLVGELTFGRYTAVDQFVLRTGLPDEVRSTFRQVYPFNRPTSDEREFDRIELVELLCRSIPLTWSLLEEVERCLTTHHDAYCAS